MILSERVRMARRRKGLSQAQLAGVVQVQRSAVSNWESMRGNPTVENLATISRITEVAFEWLATGRGPMTLAHDPLDDIPPVMGLADTEEECRMLQHFRLLDRREQALVIEMATALASGSRRQRGK